MCARTMDESLNNTDSSSSRSDIRQIGNDVMTSTVTSSRELPVAPRPRRRGVPVAWRYSLPSIVTHSIAATTDGRRPQTSKVLTPLSISGNDSKQVSGVGCYRPLCKYMATGSINVTESGPRNRPNCLRYSYWLTLDDRRYISKYSKSTGDKFSGYENHLRRHNCETINSSREPALCRVVSPRNDDNESVLQLHRTCSHVTGSPEQTISSITSALDVKTGCAFHATHLANRTRSTLCLNPDGNHVGLSDDRANSVNDVNVDRSRDEVGGGRRLSLSKIGDSGLGTSIHSEQTSPDETGTVDHDQPQHQRLCDNDVSECQCQPQCEGHCEGHGRRRGDEDDVRTKLTRHKCEYYCHVCVCMLLKY